MAYRVQGLLGLRFGLTSVSLHVLAMLQTSKGTSIYRSESQSQDRVRFRV